MIRRAHQFGASGFIPKSSPASIGQAVAAVLDGGVWTPPDVDLGTLGGHGDRRTMRRLATLTPQQVRVLMRLADGLLNKQIAYELGVAEKTVKAHVSAILKKLGRDSRTQAVIACSKIGATLRPAATASDPV